MNKKIKEISEAKNMTELSEILSADFDRLKKGLITPEQARKRANEANKIIREIQKKLSVNEKTGKVEKIPFLEK